MADATDKAGADAGKSGAALADLDLKLLFTAGAVGLYATCTLLKNAYKAWSRTERVMEAASLDELGENPAPQTWDCSVTEQLEAWKNGTGAE